MLHKNLKHLTQHLRVRFLYPKYNSFEKEKFSRNFYEIEALKLPNKTISVKILQYFGIFIMPLYCLILEISKGLEEENEENLKKVKKLATKGVTLTGMAEGMTYPNAKQFIGAAVLPTCDLKGLLNTIINHENM